LLSETFACPVLNNYCSTEGGEIAMSCPEGHLHVNIDWVILEPVDDDNRPVPPGLPSSGVLLTNLANLVQPVIRYRLTDKVIWHDEPCRCGLHMPYIELQGREEEILTFENPNRRVPISPTVMMLVALDTEGCNGAQFIQRAPDRLEVRWDVKHGFDRHDVGEKLKHYLHSLFENNAIRVDVILSSEPFIRTKGGKCRAVFRAF
jgi:phenylacetate-coenzyme A ligase PaaK-like adenylate-forming protein